MGRRVPDAEDDVCVLCETDQVTKPEGFSYVRHKSGEVAMSRHGRPVTVLRGCKAEEFMARLPASDAQELMARATGNYQRGNERQAAGHPRRRR